MMLVRRNDGCGEGTLANGWNLFGGVDKLFEGFLGDRWNGAADGWTPSRRLQRPDPELQRRLMDR